MTAPEYRAPFDDEDAAAANRYLQARGLTAFDPFAAEDAKEDVIFLPSLRFARWAMEQSFGTATESGRRFRAYPVVVERSSPNAFAIDVEGVHVCGVNIGLFTSLIEISMFVFSQSTLFPEIGDATGEPSPMLPRTSQLAFWMSDELRADPTARDEPLGAAISPRDPQRLIAAHLLTQLMLRFAWLHELYHALNGHCGLLASLGRGTALNEMPNTEPAMIVDSVPDDSEPRWQSTLHCLEFDADRTAIWAMIRLQEGDGEPIRGLAAMPLAVRLKLVLFAGFMMTFLFDQAAKRIKTGSNASHPLAYQRLHNLVRTIASHPLDQGDDTKHAFDDVLNEVTRLRQVVPELFSAEQLLTDLRNLTYEATFGELEEALEASRRLCRPFAYFQL